MCGIKLQVRGKNYRSVILFSQHAAVLYNTIVSFSVKLKSVVYVPWYILKQSPCQSFCYKQSKFFSYCLRIINSRRFLCQFSAIKNLNSRVMMMIMAASPFFQFLKTLNSSIGKVNDDGAVNIIVKQYLSYSYHFKSFENISLFLF